MNFYKFSMCLSRPVTSLCISTLNSGGVNTEHSLSFGLKKILSLLLPVTVACDRFARALVVVACNKLLHML